MVKTGIKLDQEENKEIGLLDATNLTFRVLALENNC